MKLGILAVFCLLISSLLAVGGQPGKANPAVKAEDVKSSTNVVVMLGDSTTFCNLNTPGERLTDLVQTYLTKEQIPASVVNSGIGSATAKIGLSRLKDQVLVYDPALVTISFGLNDTGRSNPEEYRECLGKMVQSIQTNTHAKILLVTSTPFINERHQWRGQFTAKGGIDAALDTKFCSVMRLLAKVRAAVRMAHETSGLKSACSNWGVSGRAWCVLFRSRFSRPAGRQCVQKPLWPRLV